jgi:hypothetical protein
MTWLILYLWLWLPALPCGEPTVTADPSLMRAHTGSPICLRNEP